MTKKNILIFLLLAVFVLTTIFVWSLISSKEVTNINIKSIPKNCKNYIIINTSKISDQIASYFFKNPSTLLKLYENTKEIKSEFDGIDLNLNEPIVIFWDEETEMAVANFSITDSKKIDPTKFDLTKFEEKNSFLYINENKNSIYYKDDINNQIRVFFSTDEISAQLIKNKFISKFSIEDSLTFNQKALNQFKKATKNTIFHIDNNLIDSIGFSNNYGEIDFNYKQISFSISGNTNDQLIFKDSDSLIYLNNYWANFTGKFNSKNLSLSKFENIELKNHWNGAISIGLGKIKNVNKLMNIKKSEDLLECFEKNMFVGIHDKTDFDSISLIPKTFKNNISPKGIIITDQESITFSTKTKGYFKAEMNFEKLLNQKINDFAWTSISLILKKLNLRLFDIKCIKENDKEYKIDGKIVSIDSSKHILFSPLIY